MRQLPRRIPWLLVLPLLLLAPLPTASADVPPPDGWRPQPHDVAIDFGPYGEVMPRTHVVAKGDTFGDLALQYLGTSTRWEEIAKANPKADPKKLVVGTKLTIPAKSKPLDPSKPETRDGPKHRWDFFAFTPIWNQLRDLPPSGRIRSEYHMGTGLVAVRHDKTAELTAILEKGPWSKVEPYLRSLFDPKSTEPRPDWVALGPWASKGSVKDTDPVLSTVDTRRIVSISNGVITTERVHLKKFGKGGKVLSDAEIIAKRHKGAMVFIFLGLIGFVLLVHITMRRRRAQQQAQLTASPTATAALVLALVVGPAAPAFADVTIPGYRNTTTTVVLDFGPYANYTTQVYVVPRDAKDPKLPSMTVHHSLHKHIKPMLAGVDTKNLKPGQRVSFPPSGFVLPVTKAESDPQPRDWENGPRKRWWHVFSAPSPSVKLTPFGHGQEVPVLHYGTQVFAVRNDHLADFKKRFAASDTGGYRLLRALAKEKPAWFATTNAIDAGRGSVKSSSPIYRTEKRMRITSMGNGVMAIETVSTTHFGKDGKKLTKDQIAAAGRMNTVLLLVAGSGLVGLLALLLRRRRAVTSPAA